MKSATTLQSIIGHRAELDCTGLSVLVEILDARSRFGTVDALVRPVAGSGQRWVDCRSLVPVKSESGIARA